MDLSQIIMTLVSAGAIYGGIRSDIRGMHREIREAKSRAEAAHDRINHHIETRHSNG